MMKRGLLSPKSSWPHFVHKTFSQGKVTTLIIYGDDIIVIEDDHYEIIKLKTYLAKEFEIIDLESLWYLLGI